MACHYFKLNELVNEIAKDVMTFDVEKQADMLKEFDEARKPIYLFLQALQKEKEQKKPETSVTLPEVVIKAKMEASGLVIQQSHDYASSLSSLPSEYRDLVHDYVHVYGCFMLRSFMIVDGKCLTTYVTHPDVTFGKFKFKSITVEVI